MSESKIINLQGQPINSEPTQRFAIVGQINIHFAVYELKEGENVGHAMRTHQLLASKHDPKLRQITTSLDPLFWAEDDDTRETNRNLVLAQVLSFMTSLRPDGSIPRKSSPEALVEEFLKRADGDEKEGA